MSLGDISMAAWLPDILAVVIVGLLIFAALVDIATRTIPDGVAIAVALLGICGRLLFGLPGLTGSVVAALILFALLVFLNARGLMGGGDVKLAAATALGLPVGSFYQFLIVTSVAGGIVALVHLFLRTVIREPPRTPPRGASLLRRVLAVEGWRIARRGSLPYGVAIACGGIWAVIMSRGG
jgi:prepilin peptidase CpaA